MGKSTISMAIFNSYVKLPEGIWTGVRSKLFSDRGMPGTCNSKGVLVSIEEITFKHEEWKQAALVTAQIKFEENRNSFDQKKKNVSPP